MLSEFTNLTNKKRKVIEGRLSYERVLNSRYLKDLGHSDKLVDWDYKKGFTLIELIIAMSITVIMATFGFLNIISYKNRQDLNSASQEIVAVLRNAQDRSLSQEGGSRWGVHFENSTSGSVFYTLFQGSSYATGIIASQTVLPSSVQFDSPTTGSSANIVFFSITGLPDATLTVKISLISNSTASSTIVISSNGKISF